MKILLLTTLVALAAADVSHLVKQQTGYQYQNPISPSIPQTSYGAPQSSVLGNIAGSLQSVPYSGSGSSSVPEFSLPSVSGPSLKFNSGFSSPSSLSGTVSGATVQTYENGAFSTPVPLTQDALKSFQVSTISPRVDVPSIHVSTPSPVEIPSVNLVKYQQPSSSYQFLSQLSQPSAPSIGISGGQISSDAVINSGFGQTSYSSNGQLNSGFGLAGSTVENDAQFNSGLGLGGSQFISKSSAGSINDAFGIATNAAGSVDISGQVAAAGHLEPEVSKNLYFFDAPEDEEEEAEAKIIIPPVAPKKTYKIIFIKAPSYRNKATITIPAPPPTEEKTLVYVLVKKPEKATNVRFAPVEPTKPSKPEVFFIKYKTQKEAEDAVAEIQNKHGAAGQVVANLPAGHSVDTIQIPTDIGISSTPASIGFENTNLFGSGGFAAPRTEEISIGAQQPQVSESVPNGDTFRSFGAVTSFSKSAPYPSVYSAASDHDGVQQPEDSGAAPSEDEQVNVHFGSQDTFQGFGAAPAPSEDQAQPSDHSATSNENEVSSSPHDDDKTSSNDDSDQPDFQNAIEERIKNEPEGEGSSIANFKTYGAPNPSKPFNIYGPPKAF